MSEHVRRFFHTAPPHADPSHSVGTIHALLPLFLTTTLGASVLLVGIIDGVAESTAAISKVFSGYLSDRMGRRKPLILLGYGLGALSKPFFAIAATPLLVFGARFADRIGKGLRGAPRDALVADVTPPEIRGRAYGLRQALDTAGAFAGPLIAIALMALFAGNMRAVFWAALIPAALAVVLVVVGVEDRATGPEHARPPVRIADLKRLPPGIALWGAHMALTQGLLAKLVADNAPAELRGSAFGFFNLATGVALLAASVAAGVLWDLAGPQATFLGGVVFAAAAAMMLASVRRSPPAQAQ